MPPLTPQQLKKTLVANGFEVFRTVSDEIILAERVRENLILDSGVRIGATPASRFRISVVFRAQRTHFPKDDEAKLLDRARSLATVATSAGFSEASTEIANVTDPADPTRTLDTFYGVVMTREVDTIDETTDVLKVALSFEKSAGAGDAS